MNQVDAQYLRIMGRILRSGSRREGRNGFTLSLFGEQMRFDLSDGFPLLTTKRVHFKSIVVELLWFLRGDTNVRWLQMHGVTIWDEWADERGDLGPVYGSQWRRWPYWKTPFAIDQIAKLLDGLRHDPFGRRHVVTAWNPAEIDQMALPPCHCFFQCYVADGKLSLHLYQRSADWFLGVPFNIASYALLTHLIAREVGLDAGELVMSFGDIHLYGTHLEQARMQLERSARPLPAVQIASDAGSILNGTILPEHVVLVGYDPHPAIKAEVSA